MKNSAKVWVNNQKRFLSKLLAFSLAFLLLFSPFASVFAKETTPPVPAPVSVSEDSSLAIPPVIPSDPGLKKEKIDPLPLPLPQPLPLAQPPVPEQTDVTINESLTQIKQTTKASLTPDIDNLTGAMVYKYDISVPAGRNKATPNIALSYNSANATRNSIIGSGWSLNIPSIERVNKDGIEKLFTENYYSSSLSGELFSTDGINYTAKNETGDFLKYQKTGSGWMVTSKDGTKYKFGINAQARQDNSDGTKIFKWMLEEERNTNDNYISYEYFKDVGQIYPSKIAYTGNGATAGIFTINFDRIARNNAMPFTDTGFSVTTNYNISEIRTEINGDWSKKYALAYTASDNGQNILLNTITESGKDELGVITTLPATDFDYQTSIPNWTYDLGWSSSIPMQFFIPGTGQKDQGVRMADLNGDGLLDYVCANGIDPGVVTAQCHNNDPKIYLNNGSGWTDVSATWTIPDKHDSASNKEIFVNWTYQTQGLQLIDVNRDNLADLVRAGSDGFYYVYLNTSSGWTYDSSWSSAIPIQFLIGTPGKDYGVRMTDINGDGLPDFVCANNFSTDIQTVPCHINDPKIYLNTGSGWTDASSTWTMPDKHDSAGNKEFFVASNYQNQGLQLIDVNGDGLVDLVRAGADGNHYVYLSNGHGWTYNPTWSSFIPLQFFIPGSTQSDQGVRVIDINGDGLPDFICSNSIDSSITAAQCHINDPKIYLNTGSGWVDVSSTWTMPEKQDSLSNKEIFANNNYQDQGLQFFDVNGDGLIDLVRAREDGLHYVYLNNNSTQSNILTKIRYSQGGNTTVTYKATPLFKDGSNNLLNPNLSMEMEVVAQIVNDDGLGNTETNTYSYQGGKYYFNNYLDRKLAGFASISKTDNAGNVTKTFYHQGDSTNTALGEYDDHSSKIGMPYRVEEYDNAGHLYRLTVNKIDKYNIGTDHNFVKNIRQTILAFDGGAAHKDTAEEYVYDNTYGNLTQKTSWGEVTGASDGSFTDVGTDKSTENISYVANTTNYVVGLPYQDIVVDQNSNKVRESKMYYDSLALGSVGVGNQTKNENWKTGSTYVNTQKTYNAYGLVADETDARGAITHYTYDSYNLYPATITNPQNQNTNYVYNYTAGKPKQITDPNNFIYQTTFDGLGRPLSEKQPDLTSPSSLVTRASYIYTDTPGNTSVQKTNYLNDGTSTNAYIYVDGLGRKFQEKKVAQSGYLTKDYTYNNRGLLDKESLPYNSGSGMKTMSAGANNLNTVYTYDALNRVATETNAVGITTYTYTPWKTTITDANGKVKNYYKDAYNNLIKVEEINAGTIYTTNYEWNLNKKLTKITDALGNVRNFTYDGLGRKLSAEDLHTIGDTTYGMWNYVYDDAGNMAQSTSPEAKVINYTYDNLNRISTEDYAGQEGIEMTYTYDTCTNGIGKICSVATNVVTTSYSYNPLGGIEREIKNINGIDYQAGYTYDRQENILEITSPDGSKIKYTYGSQGLLSKIERKENTDANYVDVVTNIDYSPAEQPTNIFYANGVITTNTYDATKLYRLVNKKTTSFSNQINATLAKTLADRIKDSKEASTIRTESFSSPVTVKALVVGGGGGGAYETNMGAGGGSGGQVQYNSSLVLNMGNYAVVVGNGGGGGTTYGDSTNGENSTFESIVSIGGGHGGDNYVSASAGAYGGGGYGNNGIGATGIVSYKGGNGAVVSGGGLGGGGGGAGGNGGNGGNPSLTGGAGGSGIANFISGTSAKYGGGGGGGAFNGYLGIGTDGGGNGGDNNGNHAATTGINGLGGGGGGSGGYYRNGANGGKGVVIIRYPTDRARINTGGTITTDGPDTVHTFTSSGIFTVVPYPSNESPVITLTGSDLISLNVGDTWVESGYTATDREDGNITSSVVVTGSVDTFVAGIYDLIYGVTDSSGAVTSVKRTVVVYTQNNRVLQDLSYTYDAVGNITKIVDASNTGTAKIVDYVYDDLNRMTSATATSVAGGQNAYTQNYSYDAIGNILTGPLGTYLYQGNVGANYANPHAATSINGVANSYDKDGNLISDGTLTNTWDYKGRLISTNKDTSTSNYYYDQSGARVRSENNGSSTYYVNKYYSVDPSDKKTKNIYAGDNLVSTVETTTYILSPPVRPCGVKIPDPTERLVAEIRPIEPVCRPSPPMTSYTTTSYYNHTDHLGSVNVVTDQDGNQAEILDYYPFGNQRISSGSRTAQRQYIGQIYDIDTGLNYLNARYYDGNRGQFISEDSQFWDFDQAWLADPQNQNAYAYARNNPIVKSDPTGKSFVDILGRLTFANITYAPGMHESFTQSVTDQNYKVSYDTGIKNLLPTYAKYALQDSMIESNEHSALITSTVRTPEKQAEAMYQNTLKTGIDAQFKLYGPYGDQVLKMYPDLQKMTNKIYELGPANVSPHMKDPNVKSVFDVAPSSIKNQNAFTNAIKNNIKVDNRNFFYPGGSHPDTSYHLEVFLPKN